MNAIHGLIDVSLLNPQHFSSCVKKGHTLSHSSYERGTNSLRRTNRTGLLEPLRCKAASRLNQRQRGFCQHRHWLRRKYERLEFARGASLMWPMHDLFRDQKKSSKGKRLPSLLFFFSLFLALQPLHPLCRFFQGVHCSYSVPRSFLNQLLYLLHVFPPFLVNVDQSYYRSRTP